MVSATFPAILPDWPFNPSAHLFYSEAVQFGADSLPKYVDGPKEMGGSGELAQ